MRRARLYVALSVALIAAVGWISTPPSLTYVPPVLPASLPAADSVPGLVPGTEKRISYAGEPRLTEWSVVYLHGFSATRQETAPLAERVAEALDANLFETRLTGHGLQSDALVGATAENWLDDTAEALAAGAALGDKVIVIATSTGATLATALLDHELMNAVDALVFLSPNFGLRNKTVRYASGPFGKILTRLLAGETLSWTPDNEAQGLYWSTHYPSSAVIEMVRTLDLAESKLTGQSRQRWLLMYSQSDDTIDPAAAIASLDRIEARTEVLFEVSAPNDDTGHILAGDIMSPHTTDEVVRQIVEFILHPQIATQ